MTIRFDKINVENGKTYFLYEQTSVLGIIAEPGEALPVDLTPDAAPPSKITLHS